MKDHYLGLVAGLRSLGCNVFTVFRARWTESAKPPRVVAALAGRVTQAASDGVREVPT